MLLLTSLLKEASAAACNTNPLFAQSYYTSWKGAPGFPADFTTLLSSIEGNTAEPVSGSVGFCKNNSIFTVSCCTEAKLKQLFQMFNRGVKPLMKQGTPGCAQMYNVSKVIPRKCLKSSFKVGKKQVNMSGVISNATGSAPTNVSQSLGDFAGGRPPAGKAPQVNELLGKMNKGQFGDAVVPGENSNLTVMKEQFGEGSNVVKAMQNSSKGMVGLINGVMRYLRTISCIICSGSPDWTNIFDASNKIIWNSGNHSSFKKNLSQAMFRLRESDKDCQAFTDELVANMTDTTVTGCSGVPNDVKGRRADNAAKCADNTTCENTFDSMPFGNPLSVLNSANIQNCSINDVSASNRILQSSYSSTSSNGGVSVATAGSDDYDSYGGVSAFAALILSGAALSLIF